MRVACSRKGAVSFTAKLSRVKFAETAAAGPNTLRVTGTSTGQPGDLRFEAQARVHTQGGTVTASADGITVKDADEAIVFLTAGTDYLPAEGSRGRIARMLLHAVSHGLEEQLVVVAYGHDR